MSNGKAELDLHATQVERAGFEWPKLDKPAKVGPVRFNVGVSSRAVVEAAQRRYEYEVTPEKEAERIAAGHASIAAFWEKAMAEPAPAQGDREAFEAHLVAHHGHQPYTLRSLREGDSYSGVALPLAWSVWQARRAQTGQQTWTDSMVRDFLSVALRHVEVKGALHAQDIRDALRYMAERYAAPIAQTAPQPQQSGLVLMPKEATPEIVAAMKRELDKAPTWYCRYSAAYRAALSAQGESHE